MDEERREEERKRGKEGVKGKEEMKGKVKWATPPKRAVDSSGRKVGFWMIRGCNSSKGARCEVRASAGEGKGGRLGTTKNKGKESSSEGASRHRWLQQARKGD